MCLASGLEMSLLRHECRKLVRTVAISCLVFAHKCWFVQHLSTRLYSLVQHGLVWCSAEPAKPLLGSHHSSRKFSLNWTSVLRSAAQRGATTKSAGPASSTRLFTSLYDHWALFVGVTENCLAVRNVCPAFVGFQFPTVCISIFLFTFQPACVFRVPNGYTCLMQITV